MIRTEKSGALRDPVGRALDHRHHRYRAGSSTGASRRVPRDLDYLLEQANRATATPLRHDDIESVYAGLRPLLAGDAADTSSLSREHVVTRPLPGLVSVAGGKYTTYRLMARDAVDAAVEDLPEAVPASVSDRVQLLGADGYLPRLNASARIAETSGLDVAAVHHLLDRYGGLIDDLLRLVEKEPALGRPLEGAEGYLAAEVVYAATREGAMHLEDLLTRRTRISIETFDRGTAAAGPAAKLMARSLGWSRRQTASEVEHYRLRVEAERNSQLEDDDTGANEVRLSAPDIVATIPLAPPPS